MRSPQSYILAFCSIFLMYALLQCVVSNAVVFFKESSSIVVEPSTKHFDHTTLVLQEVNQLVFQFLAGLGIISLHAIRHIMRWVDCSFRCKNALFYFQTGHCKYSISINAP